MKTDKFSDRTDVSIEISLYEYGLIRNPKTNKCIHCLNTNELWNIQINKIKPIIKTSFISIDDVREAIEEQSIGYFDYIGSTKENELNNIDNNYLAMHIFSLKQYSGIFIPIEY